jgi:hypothetical protein
MLGGRIGKWLGLYPAVVELEFQPEDPLAYVLAQRDRGARVRLYTDVYGNHGAVVSTGWFHRRRVRVAMTYADVSVLKACMRNRSTHKVRGHNLPKRAAAIV